MLMLSTGSATSIFAFKSVRTDYLPNIFPEIARSAGSALLLSFAIVRSRWSMLSNLVNWTLNGPRSRDQPFFMITVLISFWAATELEKTIDLKPGTSTIGSLSRLYRVLRLVRYPVWCRVRSYSLQLLSPWEVIFSVFKHPRLYPVNWLRVNNFFEQTCVCQELETGCLLWQR